MQPKLAYSIILMTTCIAITTCSTTIKKTSSSSVFVGTTPCSNVIRPLLKIPGEPDCASSECRCVMVEWKLTLYLDPITGAPVNYELSSINRFVVKETNMYSQPGTKTESKGTCKVIRGTKTNPRAILYRLNPENPALSIDLVKLSDNLLHVVDREGALMIGNEFWSYTLSRVAN